MGVSLSNGATNCNSLRKLSLLVVHLDENMLQTLLSKCPLIVDFIIEYCFGLERIELLNLQNIKSVSLRKKRNQCFKIQAPTLEHLFYSSISEYSLMSDIVECQYLKSLKGIICQEI